MEKIIMTKGEFADLIEVKSLADAFDALMQTIQAMEANEDLTVDNLVSLLLGIYGGLADRYNELITKHGLNEKSIDDIEIRSLDYMGAE